MDTLNIGGNEQDRFYRYKMPKLISKIEGKGNGIKTVVPNMSDIARSLGRPPTYPTKFFGCELGAQVKCDDKNDRYIVNGAHEASRLQELLDVFIKKFVLCAGCQNPETDLIIAGKTQKVIRDCKACGQRTEVDMRHKLVTYILKNPPTPKEKSKKGKKATTKKSGNGDLPESPTTPTKGEGSEEVSEDELTRAINAAAAELPIDPNREDDDDWVEETSPEAVRRRMKDLENGVNLSLVIGDNEVEDDGSSDELDPHDQLAEWLKENKGLPTKDIYRKIKELGLSKENDKMLEILVLGLFDSHFRKDATISKQIQKRAKFIVKFIHNVDDQRDLLGATEILIEKYPELLDSKVICKILMEYYQAELIEEEVFQAWIAGEESESKDFKRTANVNYVDPEINKEIRNKAKPFAKWLEEAEEDEEEENE
ncbi:hypothetical protein G9A89_000620 [Geosiphon pyriformis]|nr:hypothetical protein G9A89_000620 [Geosiphon pyriformis]